MSSSIVYSTSILSLLLPPYHLLVSGSILFRRYRGPSLRPSVLPSKLSRGRVRPCFRRCLLPSLGYPAFPSKLSRGCVCRRTAFGYSAMRSRTYTVPTYQLSRMKCVIRAIYVTWAICVIFSVTRGLYTCPVRDYG